MFIAVEIYSFFGYLPSLDDLRERGRNPPLPPIIVLRGSIRGVWNLKLVMVTEYFPPFEFGGGELSSLTLAKNLAKISDFEVHVVTKKLKKVKNDHEIIDGINVHRVIPEVNSRIPTDFRRGTILTIHTLKALRPYLDDCNIVHAHSMRVTVGCMLAARLRGIPLVATVNDSWATCYYSSHFMNGTICKKCSIGSFRKCLIMNGGNTAALPYLIFNRKMRVIALKRYQMLLPRSKAIQNILELHGFANKMIIHPPLIDLDEFKYKPPKYTKNVLFIGRIDGSKGLDDAILAIKESNIGKLIVVGGGEDLDHYRKFAKRNNVIDNIKFVGKVNPSSVKEYIYDADLILAPFKRIEAFPRIMLEGFACGRGIIMTSISGGSDYIKNGINGYKVEVGDFKKMGKLIDQVLSNPSLIQQLSENSQRTLMTEFNPEKILQSYVKLYRELAES